MSLALIVDPYLDTLGGGERYAFTAAEVLSLNGWQVVFAWPDLGIIEKARKRFGLELKHVEVSQEFFNLFSQKSSLPLRYQSLKSLDLTFIISDGSIPLLFSKKNILHYQVPFTKINRFNLLNQLKLTTIGHIVVNSHFTKKVIDKTLNTSRCEVLYPPVDVDNFLPGKKEKIILSVGRFATLLNSKRLDVLVTAFQTLIDGGLKDWQLVLAGGLMGQESELNELKEQAKGYPVKFVVNPDFNTLKKLYSSASLYWHAAGFEVDEELNPESVEHFGITTVEAMAAGCVPLVVNKGGQKEIVSAKTGYLWDSVDELVTKTNKLISHKKLLQKYSTNAITRAQDFSKEKFSRQFLKLL